MDKKGRIATIGTAAIAVALAASLIIANIATVQKSSALLPADKVAVASSAIAVDTESYAYPDNSGIVLSSGTLKSSSPADLYIQFDTECTLVTDLNLGKTTDVSGISSAEAVAEVNVWVTLDGNPVPVTSITANGATGNALEDSKVTYCDRAFKVSTNTLNQISQLCQATLVCTGGEPFLDIFLKTKSTHSFGWLALNVGSGTHVIEVHADIDKTTSSATGSSASAEAILGKRILFVDPGHLANNAVI